MKKPDFSKFEKKLGIKFNDLNLLKEAFVHRSYLNENPDWKLNHNERLEFLGDAVLELIASQYLFEKYPSWNEGLLTSLRAALVNADHLSLVAKNLGLEEFLLLSKGEAKDTGRGHSYLLANTLEALIGALYLDQGKEIAENFIKRYILFDIEQIVNQQSFKDAKSHLQEISQEKYGLTPIYKVIDSWGPDHNKHFISGVYLGDTLLAKGEGDSKQSSEQAAAQEALNLDEFKEQ